MSLRIVAWAALAVGGLLAALFPAALAHGWLAGLFFWSGVPVGSLGFLLMMRLIGGAWRDALGPAMVEGIAGLPAVALAAVPLVFMLHALYPWADVAPEGFRGAWLQPWGFVLCTIVWLGGLALVARAFARRPNVAVASLGLMFLMLVGTLAATDWLMSLDVEFHSSGFGLQALAVQFDTALALTLIRTRRADPTGTSGALMLTLLMFWGYFAYLPFFIIWSGNMPSGAAWYQARGDMGWSVVAALAALLHAVPFLALLSPAVRRSRGPLVACAGAALAGDWLQSAWLVLPAAGAVSLAGAAAFLLATIVVGGATLIGVRR